MGEGRREGGRRLTWFRGVSVSEDSNPLQILTLVRATEGLATSQIGIYIYTRTDLKITMEMDMEIWMNMTHSEA
jgi:hypothetical protein